MPPTDILATSALILEETEVAVPEAAAVPEDPQPSPKLDPEHVVRLQLAALKNNNVPVENAGIAIAFRFASPQNRVLTGPLPQFIKLVRNPRYSPMLDYDRAEFSSVVFGKDVARQIVTLYGGRAGKISYVFLLRKQPEGEFKDCWMTDSDLEYGPRPTEA